MWVLAIAMLLTTAAACIRPFSSLSQRPRRDQRMTRWWAGHTRPGNRTSGNPPSTHAECRRSPGDRRAAGRQPFLGKCGSALAALDKGARGDGSAPPVFRSPACVILSLGIAPPRLTRLGYSPGEDDELVTVDRTSWGVARRLGPPLAIERTIVAWDILVGELGIVPLEQYTSPRGRPSCLTPNPRKNCQHFVQVARYVRASSGNFRRGGQQVGYQHCCHPCGNG